ncbi:zinc-binding dehydrogenase [Tomitella biformata]|uniref:zinc-binding dehydrogenase n=1 Tax=Tomitella biformata TaxID=630403 RepID=UPI0004B14CC8|nr:zinc-binding dehydrogenase [Tomitella biformata]
MGTIRTGLQLRSLVTAQGELELSLADVEVSGPGPDEVVVRVEAAPLNPSDLGLLLGPADLSTARVSGTAERPVLTATIPAAARGALAARVGVPMPVGNEGAGVVVEAGTSDAAQALLGKTVALLGGGMYSQLRCVPAAMCLELAAGTTPQEGASALVNPMTALGMVETMRREGHSALVHTAAASNLGQMLNRVCRKDGVGLVNVVRRPEQEVLLREQGAVHVVNSTSETFRQDLDEAVAATGATIAFDATGGGTLAGDILSAMERALSAGADAYSTYGSATHKQVYLYGGLDRSPTVLHRDFGMAWGIGGWLLMPFLGKIGADAAGVLQRRIAAELTTTFVSGHAREVSLAELLDPAVAAVYNKRATGEKFLVNPQRA